MPYTISKNDKGEYCVYKKNLQTGEPMGDTHGCHKTKDEAVAQIGAIESSEAKKEHKAANVSYNFTFNSTTVPSGYSYDTNSTDVFTSPNIGDYHNIDLGEEDSSEKRRFRENVGGGVDTDKLKDSDFVLPKERKFPVVTPGDIKDAVNSWGRYKGSASFETFKKNLIALAKRKGESFVAQLPKEWKDKMEKSTDITETENVEEINFNTENIDPRFAVKQLGTKRLGGYGILWGDENAKDLHGEYFTPNTQDLKAVFNAMGKIPLVVHHGGDDSVKTFVYGEVDVMEEDEIGSWWEAKITEFEVYRKYVQPLLDRKALFSSSGTMPAARRVNKDTGEIVRWPIMEMTTTWMPAEYRMLERPIEEIKSAYKEIGLECDLSNFDEQTKEDTKGVEKARLSALVEYHLGELGLLEVELQEN